MLKQDGETRGWFRVLSLLHMDKTEKKGLVFILVFPFRSGDAEIEVVVYKV